MAPQLVYHTQESLSGGISPFDKTIHQIVLEQDIAITCPYLGIEYLQKIFSLCSSWRIISDVEAWISSHKGQARQEVVDFILDHHAFIHHYKNLHAKTIITPSSALIGSANFTKMGVLERTEMGVLFEKNAIVEELLQWFDMLWQQTDIVNARELHEYLSTTQQTEIHEEVTNHTRLSSPAPNIRAKLWKSPHATRTSLHQTMDTEMFLEQDILDLVLSRNNVLNMPQAREVFQRVKQAIPYEVRTDDEFAARTDVQRRQISFLIRNYLLFRLPYNGDYQREREQSRSVYLVYPQEDLENLQEIVETKRLQYIKTSQEPFAFFPCVTSMFRCREILQFQEPQWKSFQKACMLAQEARKSRTWNTNIVIRW